MRTILCFGDSLTWGYNPVDASRYPPEQRWPRILEAELGGAARIVEEGLNSRTAATDDPVRPSRNGLAALPMLLESHAPLDLVILMLGSNDCMPRYRLSAGDIAQGMVGLIRAVQQSQAGPGSTAPGTLLIAPPPMGSLSPFLSLAYQGGEAVSARLAEAYAVVAATFGCAFLDAGKAVSVSPADGVHLDPDGHRALALAVKDAVAPLL
ncbi:SGNH/GDSL hydrolase family protein [Methyloligella sp. 2.7D]|uniref:SGNH/GDSL hydrolase family protein n=1 Tax=unclassified Methyloligella TaxID=2625955 RepID=UPI00157CEB17|nr:SGNH/GDSL hydrolase family protein [Methyloligella sp. GL2]QKP77276.1 SGNH/GDSL hydrolase family protein [Methyloligella sp. GL2]